MSPDFLCIGAQKSGTSWLNKNIRRHPGIWMPPVKSTRYFCRTTDRPLIVQKNSGLWEDKRWQRLFRRRLNKFLRHGNRRNWQWYLKFFLRRRTDRWYLSLFTPGPGQKAGEITPAYARLEEAEVAHLHQVAPQARIIYLLRNPIDRIWSDLAMIYAKRQQKNLAEITEPELLKIAERHTSFRHSDYARTLDIWGRYYPPDRFFIGYFKQLTQEPARLLKAVYSFLELPATDEHIPANINEKRNSGRYPKMPPPVARMLAGHILEPVQRIHARLNNEHTAEWLATARRCLDQA